MAGAGGCGWPRVSLGGVLVAVVVLGHLALAPVQSAPRRRTPATTTPPPWRQRPAARGGTAGAGGVAAISLFAAEGPTGSAAAFRHVVGAVTKRAAPLLVQDRPWEPRLDNGYPNVIRRAPGRYELFYGDCVSGCGSQLLLFANSSDGLAWRKPDLGLFDVGAVRKDLAHLGRHNNIVLRGGGIGVAYDAQRGRYLATGVGCFAPGGLAGCVSGAAESRDGLVWGNATALPFPAPQRYDCHSNTFHDNTTGGRVLTTRNYLDPAGRAIGIAPPTGPFPAYNTTRAPATVAAGTKAHQLYSQITFPWLNVYLGIVMVFDTAEPATVGRVHCRLAWSPSLEAGWAFVDPQRGGLEGPSDFIPLGPAGPAPPPCTSFVPGPTSDCAAYRGGGRGEHRICAPAGRHYAGVMAEAACHAACSAWADCRFVQFEGLAASNFSAARGQCFLLPACSALEDYGNRDFCIDIAECQRPAAAGPLGGGGGGGAGVRGNAFDSHICFAAAHPFVDAGEVRLYYMGGNGPHNGPRNSSLGLATLPLDRFAGVSGSGRLAASSTLLCTGPTLYVTLAVADAAGTRTRTRAGASSLQIGLADPGSPLAAENAVALTAGGHRTPVRFVGGASFAGLVGTRVSLALLARNATLFALAFGP